MLSCDFAALTFLVFSRRPKLLLLATSSVVLPLDVARAHKSADEGETSAAETPSEKPAAEALVRHDGSQAEHGQRKQGSTHGGVLSWGSVLRGGSARDEPRTLTVTRVNARASVDGFH